MSKTETETETETKSRGRGLLLLWLRWELMGFVVFFVLFDWADVIAMACVAVDPKGEDYFECDVDSPEDTRVYTTRAHLERWAPDQD